MIYDMGIIICVLILGISLSQLYNLYHPYIYNNNTITTINQCSTQAKISGLWLPNISNLKNYNGRWICVNIDETKTLTQLQTTINHEIGHEIFAGECERNITKCIEVVENDR